MKKLLPILIFLFIVGYENAAVSIENNSNDNWIQQMETLNEHYNNEINMIQSRLSEQVKTIKGLKEDIANFKNQNKELVNRISGFECQIDSPYPYISDSKANCLINNASSIMWYLNNGGENSEITSDYAKFTINDPKINS